MRTVQSWTCELGYGADTMFHRTYFLFAVNSNYLFSQGERWQVWVVFAAKFTRRTEETWS